MNCPNCGENIQAGDRFCGSCGTPIPAKPMDLPSDSLHYPVEPDQFVPLSYEPRFTSAADTENVVPLPVRPIGQRADRRISNERSNKLLILYGLSIAIILVVLVSYFAARGSNSAISFIDTPTATPATTSTPNPLLGIGTAVPDEGAAHAPLKTVITYTTYPPSSGTHYPDTAPNGFSDVPIPEGYFVHSMEHGAVVLYYRPDISNQVKQQLKDLFNKLPPDKDGQVKLVVVPYTNGMTTPLAIAAWDRLLLMKDYNFEEIRAFYQNWVNKGPESVP